MVLYSSSSSSAHEEDSRKVNPPASAGADHGGWTQQKLTIPMGYRFNPTDIELVLDYLLKKIVGLQLPADIIPKIDVYRTNPEQLPLGKFQYWKDKEAFFFTCKDQNCLQGERTHQAELHGFWKADMIDEHIVHSRKIVGFKSMFVFYRLTGGTKEKTNWVMTEFRVHPRLIPDDAQAERLMVCRIQYDPERKSQMRVE